MKLLDPDWAKHLATELSKTQRMMADPATSANTVKILIAVAAL